METAAPESAPEVTAPLAQGAPAAVVMDVNEPTRFLDLLVARGVPVERRRLAPADFVVGPLALERKTVADFHASLLRKRLFEQLTRLKEAYPPPVALLLEGDLAFFEERQEPRAMWGALCAIAVDLGIVVLPTPSSEASADVLAVLARRVGRTGGRADVRFKPRALGPDAEQRFVVQGLPGIGDVVSANLLEHFGSLRRLFGAGEKDLQRVPGVGKGRARDITELLDRPYEGRQRRLGR